MTALVLPPAGWGVSGNVSRQILNRIGQFAIDDLAGVTPKPDVALVFGFPNDPASDGLTIDGATWVYSQASTQLYTQALALAIKHGAYGDTITSGSSFAATQATLPATGRRGERRVVLSDTSTTGGTAALDPSQTATITGTVTASGPAVWEFRRRRSGEPGWGRIAVSATAPTVCRRVVLIGTNYKNFAADGAGSLAANSAGRRDTTATPEPWYAQVRAAMQAAATAENVLVGGKASVVYADLYGYQRTMIVGGTFPASGTPTISDTLPAGFVPDFSGGATYDATKDWHHQSGNQHHNAFGHEIVARCALMSIVNAGWAPGLLGLGRVLNVKAIGDSQTDYGAGYCRASQTWVPTLGQLLDGYLAP
jgi:hypothetical protein